MVEREAPELLPYFLMTYGVEQKLRTQDDESGQFEWIGATEGSLQGDPLALLYFSLGFQDPLRAAVAGYFTQRSHRLGHSGRCVHRGAGAAHRSGGGGVGEGGR